MRIVFTWLIKTALILGFNYIGWLTLLDGHGHAITELNATAISSAALMAAAFSIVTYGLLALSLGFAALLMVFLGGAILWLTSLIASDYLVTNGFWLTVIAGFLLFVAVLPKKKQQPKEAPASA